MALVKKDEKMWGRWPERRDFRARWPPHAVSTEIRPRRAETHPILVGVMMGASILLPPSAAPRGPRECWKYTVLHYTTLAWSYSMYTTW